MLQRGDLPVLSILHLIYLVCIDYSWALHIKASVHPFRSLVLFHLHVLLLSLSSIPPANCQCIFVFAVHSFFVSYFLVLFPVCYSSAFYVYLQNQFCPPEILIYLSFHVLLLCYIPISPVIYIHLLSILSFHHLVIVSLSLT